MLVENYNLLTRQFLLHQIIANGKFGQQQILGIIRSSTAAYHSIGYVKTKNI